MKIGWMLVYGAICAVLTAAAPALVPGAMLSAQTRLEKGVIAEGGGRMASPATVLECTMGQQAADRAAAAGILGQFGFWNMVPTPASVDVAMAGSVVGVAIAPNPLIGRGEVAVRLRRSDDVDVAMYDMTGRRVATLFAGAAHAGTLFIDIDGGRFAAGRYFVAVRADGTLAQQSLTIIR